MLITVCPLASASFLAMFFSIKPNNTLQLSCDEFHVRYFEYTLSFCIYCSPIPVLSNGTCFMQLRGGEIKRATKNRTPVTWGMIELSANNGFPTRSGKKLQIETLDIDSRLIGL